jgi:hypothetical protein
MFAEMQRMSSYNGWARSDYDGTRAQKGEKGRLARQIWQLNYNVFFFQYTLGIRRVLEHNPRSGRCHQFTMLLFG